MRLTNLSYVLIGTQRLFGLALCVFVYIALCANPITQAEDDQISNLSLEQKVAQMFIVNLYGSQLTEAGRDFLTQYQPGGVVLLPENIRTPEDVTRLNNLYQQTIIDGGGLPLFISVDQEGGTIAHLRDGFTRFPVMMLLTASGDTELAYRVGQAMAEEMLAVGVNMNLAPVADLETNPNNPIIRRRSFGSDPAMVSPIVGAYIAGMQATNVLATAKHFPGHGDTSDDSHVGLPVVALDRERLEAVELAPFRAAIEAGVSTIMVAHIWYPALEPQPDLPASMSPNIITGLLREEMGYDGLIVTDALDMDAIDTVYSYPNASLQAIKAGVDLVIAAHVSLEAQAAGIQRVVDAVRSGEISEERINASFRRIMAAKSKYGVLNWRPIEPTTANERLNLDAHAELVTEIFDMGVTVAVDRNTVVPFKTGQTVAVIFPGTRPRIQQECSAEGVTVKALAVSETPTESDIASAQRMAAQVDFVVVFSENADVTPQRRALVNALPPDKTIAVALASPYDWTTYPQVAGYVVTYSPLPQAVPAACGVLFGRIPANGKLSIALDGLIDSR